MPNGDERTGAPEIPPIPEIKPIPPIEPVQAPPPSTSVKRSPKPKTNPFFLKEVSDSDPMFSRGAAKKASLVQPLIDGILTLTQLEKAIGEATSNVLIAFWFLHPDMPLRSGSRPAGSTATTWLELLLEAAKRGVQVRVFFSDFDPLFFPKYHRHAWASYFQIVNATIAQNIPQHTFQVVCSIHEHEIPELMMAAAAKKAPDLLSYSKIEKAMNAEKDKRKQSYDASPGLWDKMDFDATSGMVKLRDPSKSHVGRPGSHHQKLIIVDGMRAFAGGLNVGTAYPDFRQHNVLPLPWHDAFVKVEGKEILEDFIRNYVGMWNREQPRCEAFLRNAFASRKDNTPAVIGATTALDEKTIPAKSAGSLSPNIPSQVRRTVSVNNSSDPLAPKAIRQDILEGYSRAIEQANEFLYFENQYFRDTAILDAIVKRRKTRKHLKVIMLIPKVIEEADTDRVKEKLDPISKHGAFLQFAMLKKMRTQFGDDLGLFSMERTGGKQVYVHSKVLIVDDVFASIGSANSNPRCYRMDTELDFVWHDAATVKDLRLNLWKEVLGSPPDLAKWKPSQYVTKWQSIAATNFAHPDTKKGFLIAFSNILEGEEFPINISNFT